MSRLQYYYRIATEPTKSGPPRHTYSIGLGMTEPSYYKNVALYRYLLNPYYNATIDDILFEDYFFDKLHYKPFDHFTIHETRPEPTQFYSVMDKQIPVINEKIPFDEWHSIPTDKRKDLDDRNNYLNGEIERRIKSNPLPAIKLDDVNDVFRQMKRGILLDQRLNYFTITWELDNEKKPKGYRLALEKNTRNLDPLLLKENEIFMTYEDCEAAAQAEIAKIEDDIMRAEDEAFYYEVSHLPISEPEKKRLSQLPHSYGFSFRRHENSILFRPSRDSLFFKVIQR